MNLDPMIFINGILNPVAIKIFIGFVFLAIALGIFRRLIDKKLKGIKPVKLNPLVSFVIAVTLFIFALVLFNNLK